MHGDQQPSERYNLVYLLQLGSTTSDPATSDYKSHKQQEMLTSVAM